MIELAAALARGPSYLTLATILSSREWTSERVDSIKKSINDYLQKRDVEAMVKVFPSTDVLQGAEALIKGYGFGPLEPNTILLGESQVEEKHEAFVRLIRLTYQLNKNLVMVREGGKEEDLPENPRIDIWWRGRQLNIGLMVTLAYQLRPPMGKDENRAQANRHGRGGPEGNRNLHERIRGRATSGNGI
ncbi:MAG: hypothetical protein JJU29_13540 [Verrucomicrobia bacterium]|nr:hypothetical protein [Verrucomicrobiota bacterium]